MADIGAGIKRYKSIAESGLVRENPVFRLVLGICPTLALSTAAKYGLWMGLATTFVLIITNTVISMLRKVIPDKVRLPAFIMIIATFVTVLEMLLFRFMPDIYIAMGVYLPLIAVNCVVFARAEAFASANPVFDSALDGLFMGLGFTLGITLLGAVREFLGSGRIFGATLVSGLPFLSVLQTPMGGFLVFGLLMALFNFLHTKHQKRKEASK